MGRYLSRSCALWVAVLATIGNVLVQAQFPAGCTTSSFTTPSWLVENFESRASANSTAVSYHALNRATNVSVELACPASGHPLPGGWHSCEGKNATGASQKLLAAFQATRYTAYFLFNETWTCSDLTPAKPITFTAWGNSSVPVSCSTDSAGAETCKATEPLLVPGELLSPIKITPGHVSGPPGHDARGCTAQSKTPSWEVTETQFNFQNVSGTIQGGSAFVIIQNTNLDYIATCGGFFNATEPQPLSCQGQTVAQRLPKYHIETVVLFEPKTFSLTVNQTWFCDDESPSKPLSISGTGTTALSLSCQVFTDEITFCTGGSATFNGTLTSQTPLPPYSLDDPLATADSCTISSIVSPAWWLSDFGTTLAVNNSNSDVGNVTFGLELKLDSQQPAGEPTTVAASAVRLLGGGSGTQQQQQTWYPCAFEAVGDPALGPTGCSFRYDMTSRRLTVRVDWSCNDLDAHSPVAFSGEVLTTVPDLLCTTEKTTIVCASTQGWAWDANVISVTWR